MNFGRTANILAKDLALGPRTPFFLYALILPVALTIVFQVAFGSLFDPMPRLGIYDEGRSRVALEMRRTPGIEVTMVDSADRLKTMVEANDLDAGLILPAGFDRDVRRGEQPRLQIFIGGESLASNRIVLSVTTLDLVREIEGRPVPVDVELVSLGEEGLPISVRLVPVVMFYALVIAGVFVPGSSLVEEKEKETLTALLVTPVRTSEVLAAKWALGVILASAMSFVTLLMNRALGSRPAEVTLVILIAAALTSTLGIIVGAISKDTTTLFSLIKGMGIFLAAPVLFYLFPDWPQWIAKIFPLYWILEPIWQVSILGNPISDVYVELAVALAITAGLAPIAIFLGRGMQERLAGG